MVENRRISNIKGFTVIELSVAVTIIGILLVVVLASFSGMRDQFSLKRIAHRFAQDIRRAQNMALSQVVVRDGNGAPQAVDGFGTYLDLNSLGETTYLIYADRAPGNQEYDANDYVLETIDITLLESKVIIKTINQVVGNKVNFYFTGTRTIISPLVEGVSEAEIEFGILGNDRTQKVAVTNAGLVEVR